MLFFASFGYNVIFGSLERCILITWSLERFQTPLIYKQAKVQKQDIIVFAMRAQLCGLHATN